MNHFCTKTKMDWKIITTVPNLYGQFWFTETAKSQIDCIEKSTRFQLLYSGHLHRNISLIRMQRLIFPKLPLPSYNTPISHYRRNGSGNSRLFAVRPWTLISSEGNPWACRRSMSPIRWKRVENNLWNVVRWITAVLLQ